MGVQKTKYCLDCSGTSGPTHLDAEIDFVSLPALDEWRAVHPHFVRWLSRWSRLSVVPLSVVLLAFSTVQGIQLFA